MNYLKKKTFIKLTQINDKKRLEVLKQRRLEHEAIQEFLKTYGNQVVKLTNSIKKMVRDKRAEKEILELISQRLKKDIPVELLPTILEYTRRIWQAGSTVETDAGTIIGDIATDQNAIDFFTRQQELDFGKVFTNMDKPLKEAVLESLKGRVKSEKEILKKLSKVIPDTMTNKKAVNHYRLIISNAVNKSRNFARTLTYEEIGIQTLEIVAIVDRKTSQICRTMNGRRIDTKTAKTYVKEVMDTEPSEVVKKFPWPKSVPQGVSTNKILKGIEVKLPPYHGRCRYNDGCGFTRDNYYTNG